MDLYELAMSGSNVGFLTSGVTRASFNWLRKTPCWNERLHRWHSVGQMVVEIRLSNQVGIGSNVQDLAGSVNSSWLISETLVGSNSVSGGTTSLGKMTGAAAAAVDARILATLSMKHLAKSSALSLSEAD